MGVTASVDYGRLAVRAARLVFGLLAAVTLVIAAGKGGNLPNFFSYFTIESNILGAVVLVVGGLLDPQSERWSCVRGACTLYLVITGIVYAALLAGNDVALTTVWINHVLHRVIPIVVAVDWVLFEPWPWLSYPLAVALLAAAVNWIARRRLTSRSGTIGR
jgi:hypothetical protein